MRSAGDLRADEGELARASHRWARATSAVWIPGCQAQTSRPSAQLRFGIRDPGILARAGATGEAMLKPLSPRACLGLPAIPPWYCARCGPSVRLASRGMPTSIALRECGWTGGLFAASVAWQLPWVACWWLFALVLLPLPGSWICSL